MLKFLLFFIPVILPVFSWQIVQPKKINITVGYNPLSPVSKKFINEQLYPVWSTNMHLINLQLLPTGILASQSQVEVEVEVENDEKIIHACVLKLFPINTAFQIIDCLIVHKINQVKFNFFLCAGKVGSRYFAYLHVF